MQLDLFAPPPPPPAIFETDPVVEALISHGYVRNEYLMDLNRSIDIGYGDLPSRLFRFPIEFVSRERQKDGQSKLWLRHPDFEGMPGLDEIERDTGIRPYWEPLDEYGRDRGGCWRYFHAVDLMTDEHWRSLIKTVKFTDRDSIICALRYCADYGGLSVKNMRAMLAFLGSQEPEDRSAEYLHSSAVRVTHAKQGKFVSMWTKDERCVWAAVHGLEDGLFKRDRDGYLRFSKAFLTEKEAAE